MTVLLVMTALPWHPAGETEELGVHLYSWDAVDGGVTLAVTTPAIPKLCGTVTREITVK